MSFACGHAENSASDQNRKIVSHCPRCAECLKRNRSLAAQRIKHRDRLPPEFDNDECVNVVVRINREERNKNG